MTTGTSPPGDQVLDTFLSDIDQQTILPQGQNAEYQRGIDSVLAMINSWVTLGFALNRGDADASYPVDTERNFGQLAQVHIRQIASAAAQWRHATSPTARPGGARHSGAAHILGLAVWRRPRSADGRRGDAAAWRDPLSSSGIPTTVASGVQAARVAADHLFGSGALAQGHRGSIMLDHQAYLRAHWRCDQTRTRWPDHPFWHFRAAQVRRVPGARVRRRQGVDLRARPGGGLDPRRLRNRTDPARAEDKGPCRRPLATRRATAARGRRADRTRPGPRRARQAEAQPASAAVSSRMIFTGTWLAVSSARGPA
ncbi:hypothetical protein [Oceanicola sp. S124]|uniref:hypothetical protein n=1 Tax=Oceanicola sp. S124 TaxID=1042378 RepID=UPI00110F87DC|nr:hypothetical protein [Oceanicola sp. S124]